MTVHYFDPSAWIKRHFQETGSDVVADLFRTIQVAACCRLGLIEMVATVARKGHAESLDDSVIQQLLRQIEADFKAFDVVPIEERLIADAAELAVRHRLRTMDAIHLAAALSLRQLSPTMIVVSSDGELLAAATAEGLATLNPTAPTP